MKAINLVWRPYQAVCKRPLVCPISSTILNALRLKSERFAIHPYNVSGVLNTRVFEFNLFNFSEKSAINPSIRLLKKIVEFSTTFC